MRAQTGAQVGEARVDVLARGVAHRQHVAVRVRREGDAERALASRRGVAGDSAALRRSGSHEAPALAGASAPLGTSRHRAIATLPHRSHSPRARRTRMRVEMNSTMRMSTTSPTRIEPAWFQR